MAEFASHAPSWMHLKRSRFAQLATATFALYFIWLFRPECRIYEWDSLQGGVREKAEIKRLGGHLVDDNTRHSSVSGQISSCNGIWNLVPEYQLINGNAQGSSTRQQRWVNNSEALLACPPLAFELKRSGNVPRVLHRIWECSSIPDRYSAPLFSWESRTSGFVVFLWTNELRQRFILEYLGERELMLYNRLIPGSYRADLFKYIVSHFIGGIYSDLDATLLVDLDTFFNYTGITVAIDLHPSRLLPGALLITPPGHMLFLCAMGEVFDHSENKKYFGDNADGSLDVTGPGVLGECVRHVLGKDELLFDPGIQQLSSFSVRLLKSFMTPDGAHTVQFDDHSGARDVIVLQPGGRAYAEERRPECAPGEHYSSLYNKKQIYHN